MDMKILSKRYKEKHCFSMIDLANSTKILNVIPVALSERAFKCPSVAIAKKKKKERN